MNVIREVKLTPKEKEVCLLIVKGYSAKEVARLLDVTPRTVDQHCANIGLKLGSKNRAHMVAHVIVRDLISITVYDL